MNELNLDISCGICLSPHKKKFSVKKYPFLKKYYENVIGVLEHTMVSSEFCYECSALLIKYNKFKEKCLNVLNILRETISKDNKCNAVIVRSNELNWQSLLGSPKDSSRIGEYHYINNECGIHEDLKIGLNANNVNVKTEEDSYVNDDNSVEKDSQMSDNDDITPSLTSFKVLSDKLHLESELIAIDYPSKTHTFNVEDNIKEETNVEHKPKRIQSINPKHLKRQPYPASETKIKVKGKTSRTKAVSTKARSELSKKWNCVFKLVSAKEIEADVARKRSNAVYKESLYKCDLCYTAFRTESTLANHMRYHSESRGKFVCDWCKKTFVSKTRVHKHILEGHMIRAYCLLCPFVGLSTPAREHSKRHNNVKYTCKYCGRVFSILSSYLTHLRKLHPTSNICASCGASFLGEKGLASHYKRSSCKPFDGNVETPSDNVSYCSICKIQFACSDAYLTHLHRSRNHTHNDSKPKKIPIVSPRKERRKHICTVCDQSVSSVALLYRHCRELHQGRGYTKRVVCEVCGAKSNCIAVHMERHKGVLFTCDLCNKDFTFKGNLIRHLKLHNGPRLYHCEVCSKSFNVKRTLEDHVKHVHMGVPYPKRIRIRRQRDNNLVSDNRKKWWFNV